MCSKLIIVVTRCPQRAACIACSTPFLSEGSPQGTCVTCSLNNNGEPSLMAPSYKWPIKPLCLCSNQISTSRRAGWASQKKESNVTTSALEHQMGAPIMGELRHTRTYCSLKWMLGKNSFDFQTQIWVDHHYSKTSWPKLQSSIQKNGLGFGESKQTWAICFSLSLRLCLSLRGAGHVWLSCHCSLTLEQKSKSCQKKQRW